MPVITSRVPDDGSFEDVVRENTSAVFGFLLRRVGDRSLAEDLTQETFLKAWRARATFRGTDSAGAPTSVRGWLCVIAANVVRDHARRAQRLPAEVPAPEHLDLPAPGDVADHLVEREALVRLHEALAGLPANHREMFLLRERDGLSYQEIAAALDCPVGTVMSGLARARQRLATAVTG